MVGENLLHRIKQGYTLKIKQGRPIGSPREYIAATVRHSPQVRLGSDGQLVNYVAGLPFPNFIFTDPQAGFKLAWNFYWRWLGDDSKTGGATKLGKEIVITIEKNGAERLSHKVIHFLRSRSRVSVEPTPKILGYDHIDWMQIIAHDYPRDVSGITSLEVRYADPSRADDQFVYVPSLRRVRRATTNLRCATLAPTEFNTDDINTFNGKVLDFNYKFIGQRPILGNFSQAQIPFERNTGDYLPLNEGWEVHNAYGLEITPRDPSYCYSKKIIFLHENTFEPVLALMWDRNGSYWKEQFAFRTSTRLHDGEEVISVGTVAIVNVQNGRASLVTAVRSYNQGYRPSFFTLATLQQVMRGGAVR